MTTETLGEARELVVEHLEVLRGYARRVFEEGVCLSEAEESDRGSRVGEFLAGGRHLKLTEREMVALVFQDMFWPRRRCACPTCRSRGSANS